MSKKIYIFLIIFLIVFGFLIFNFWKTGKIEASPGLEDVYDWAWSENIGWIRFREKIPILDMNGLAAGYTLNEGTGIKIYDSSGNNNTGDLYNGPTWPTWGSDPYPYNTALQFDGVNDYAGVPDGPSSNLNLTNAISIEAWIKGQAAGFTKTQRPSTGTYPQFQVVGDKIYYVWSEKDAFGYYQIWTGKMKTDGTGWELPQQRTFSPVHQSTWYNFPQFQVVGDKIYYVWMEGTSTPANVFQLWKGKLEADTWSELKIEENSYWPGILQPQLQVVGDKIYYVWSGYGEGPLGETHYYIQTGKMEIDGVNWLPGFPVEFRFTQDEEYPQFQVVGPTIYYIYRAGKTTGTDYISIRVAEMNTDGTGGHAVDVFSYDTYDKQFPQLQVVGSRIYYIWSKEEAPGSYQIWTAEMNTNGTGKIAGRRTTTTNWKSYPQLQVVGDKIYYTWYEDGNIMTAESDLGSVAPLDPIDRGNGYPLQFQVVGSKSYFVYSWLNNIYTGEMNSNLINKGDFYGLGVKDGKVIGFINAGVDGFKYKGEAISDTAGATVSFDLPDSTNWHHVVITYDKTLAADNLKLYLDGDQTPKDKSSFNKDINTNPFPLIIGDDFNGTIDEIRIYNKALNATDVKAHFEGTTYGVSVDSGSGKFSGYAWSGHIGWISFNRADTGAPPTVIPCPANTCDPCPDGTCIARIDLTSTGTVCGGAGRVCGWAKALVDGGGWDGWIKLGPIIFDSTNHGVWLDTSITPTHEFRGWAWGSDVIGWISFNCKEGGATGGNICADSNYQVKTSLFLNFKPTASNLSWTDKYCDVLPGVGQVTFQWLYEDHEVSPQSDYRLEIATDSGFSNKVVNCVISQTVASGSYGSAGVQVISNAPVEDCSLPLQISYGNPYYWRISVKDGLQWSDPVEGPSFTTPSHAYPWVDFNWCALKPPVNQFVRFCSIEEAAVGCESGTTCVNSISPSPPSVPDVTCYNLAGGEADCVSWAWTLPDTDLGTSSDKNPLVKFLSKGFKDVSLQVTDANGLSCPQTKTVQVEVEYPLPEWKEIPPL